MSIFEQLQKNKGTTSSALGKELATQVLQGNKEILLEAIKLVNYDSRNEKSKNIRAGAAKIIEVVAEKKPDMVSPHLEDVFPALDVKEPQTRWMIMMTFGYCAKLNPEITCKGIAYAKKFINEHQGVCLSGASERYLGQIGQLSFKSAETVLPILIEAFDDPLPNEIDWILEAFYSIFDNLSVESRTLVLTCSKDYLTTLKPSTKKRVEKIVKKFDSAK